VIPGKLVRFLENYANVAFAGVRDRQLIPFGHRVSGWRLGADHRTLTVLFPADSLSRLVESLHDNGEVAVTLEDFPSHETYQFKGRYLHHRDADEGDVEIVDRLRRRWIKSLRSVNPHGDDNALNSFVSPPSLAVDVEVLEIYLQTPGPGAGTRLIPPVKP
jgi:hypothetical protein